MTARDDDDDDGMDTASVADGVEDDVEGGGALAGDGDEEGAVT